MPHTLIDNRRTAAPVATPVLVVGGRASSLRLLDLARWAGATGDMLHVLVPGDNAPGNDEASLGRLLADRHEGAWPLQASRLLKAIRSSGARSVVLGYPGDAEGRADFALAVQRIRQEVDVDLIVYFERHQRPWKRILVPYLSAELDGGALRLAAHSALEVTLLHTVEPYSDAHSSMLRHTITDESGCTLRVVQTHDPITAAAEEARQGYDLVVLGAGGGSGRGRAFTMRQQRLLTSTDLSLVLVHTA